MKAYNKVIIAVIAVTVLIITAANILLIAGNNGSNDREYRVEIGRVAEDIRNNGYDPSIPENCRYVTAVKKYGGDIENTDIFDTDSDYVIKQINGELYRIEYNAQSKSDRTSEIIIVNASLGVMAVLTVAVLFYIKNKIILPFERLSDVPYELSKGNLTMPVKESKSRYFGRFVWGVDMLRESIEQQKERELELQKNKKTLLLSLSHDIRTPLSAIKLYSKALSKGLYTDKAKQTEIAENIYSKADETEGYLSRITLASREDFLSIEVKSGEFYLSELITRIREYYGEKLSLIGTEFTVADHSDCLIYGDIDRSVEAIQNVIENAIKYGDGKKIAVDVGTEDGCILVTVANSGCTLDSDELPHIFESFQRGKNAVNEKGSGLGLYIARQIMNKMNGEIFARITKGEFEVGLVFGKAG